MSALPVWFSLKEESGSRNSGRAGFGTRYQRDKRAKLNGHGMVTDLHHSALITLSGAGPASGGVVSFALASIADSPVAVVPEVAPASAARGIPVTWVVTVAELLFGHSIVDHRYIDYRAYGRLAI